MCHDKAAANQSLGIPGVVYMRFNALSTSLIVIEKESGSNNRSTCLLKKKSA